MLRRLHADQPATFAFTDANLAWAEGQITKYPEGREASAIIPLLWRAQEQEGWLSKPAIETVADMLGLSYIRALEVATFYFMFQLQPVGKIAHIQVCGTTSCMICGAEDLVAVCRDKIAPEAHALSDDGNFSWEEVECLGACSNAPMAQIGKDYYEDLTADRLGEIIDALARGEVPPPGPQNGRYASEPLGGLTSLKEHDSGKTQYNASAQLAVDLGETVKRIDGSEVPLRMPWQGGANVDAAPATTPVDRNRGASSDRSGEAPGQGAGVTAAAKPAQGSVAPEPGNRPATLTEPEEGGSDDLKRINGIGPKLEQMLNEMGFFHFHQIAAWSPAEVAWVDENLVTFKGRASRDDWVAQAAALADAKT
ncbi:NADH-quinone oxidoreductase subunit NuoE [uncultured Roseobacter sp.]|uniref:NADH-quinone oxidoreductase subunit NuoE n=1 Tax=uncultured Roseobacter sp. TaxID=114847 RepID=UPI0026344E1F|nr:NADH-quinone oxidoreductase subunit NuoE [uncultured Roseobacter sp.]